MKKIIFLIFFCKTLIINAQLCCGCYESHEIIDGKLQEKIIRKFCFDEKGDMVYGMAHINNGKDTAIFIGSPFPNLNAKDIEQEYWSYKPKVKKSKNEVVIKFKREQEPITVTHIYKIKDNKILEIVEKEPPFSTKYTSYFYDNRNRLVLAVEYFEGNMSTNYRQFIYDSILENSLIEQSFDGEKIKILKYTQIKI
jgi:hypothetical protein